MFDLQPIKIDIPLSEIDHFKQVLQSTKLPADPIIPGADSDDSYGTKLGDLKRAKEALLSFDWRHVEAQMNRWHHYTAEIEKTRIHFVHERSTRPNAIPLLLLHGWPFSFWDFKDVVEPLINPPPGELAFHVVIPSLPGVFLSSVVPNKDHTTTDVARIFNTLMADALGYKHYGAQGGDFGAINLRQIQINHADSCKLVHFNGFPAPGPQNFGDEALRQLPEHERRLVAFIQNFHENHTGYLRLQTTEVASLAYAMYDGLGMTSWLLGKYQAVGRGAKDSKEFQDKFWDHSLTTLLCYQYTHTSHSSMLMYKQSGLKYILDAFGKNSGGAPMGASFYEGEFFFAPKSWIAENGNLVFYKYHDKGGGHVPSLAMPETFVADLREMFTLHWPSFSKGRL